MRIFLIALLAGTNSMTLQFDACQQLDLIFSFNSTFGEYSRIWNQRNLVKPFAVVLPTNNDEVALALRCAEDLEMDVCIKSGGASLQGKSSCTGIMINLHHFNGLRFDEEIAAYAMGPASTFADLEFVAVNAGSLHSIPILPYGWTGGVGAGGFTLHGGLSIFGRTLGLMSDWVVGFDVVLANGTYVRANMTHHEDLFWALRGTGAEKFGVVTKILIMNTNDTCENRYMEYRKYTWKYSYFKEVLKLFQSFITSAPGEITCKFTATFAHSVDVECGILDLQDSSILRIFGDPVAVIFGCNVWEHIVATVHTSKFYNAFACVINENVGDVKIDKLADLMTRIKPTDKVFFGFQLMTLSGAIAANTAGAFPYRDAMFVTKVYYHTSRRNNEDDALLRQMFNILETHQYFSSFALPIEADAPSYYGQNVELLEYVKLQYDPKNIFKEIIDLKKAIPEVKSLAFEFLDTQFDSLYLGYHDAGDNVVFTSQMASMAILLGTSLMFFSNDSQMELHFNQTITYLENSFTYDGDSYELVAILGDVNEDHNNWKPHRPSAARFVINNTCPGSDILADCAAAFAIASFLRGNDSLLFLAKNALRLAELYPQSHSECDMGTSDHYPKSSSADNLAFSYLIFAIVTDNIEYAHIAETKYNAGMKLGEVENVLWAGKSAWNAVLLSLIYQDPGRSAWVIEDVESKFLGDDSYWTQGFQPVLFFSEWGSSQYFLSLIIVTNLLGRHVQDMSHLQAYIDHHILMLLNPRMSSIACFGKRWVDRHHHRWSSVPTDFYSDDPIDYWQWFDNDEANPNPLCGAVTAGKNLNGQIINNRKDYTQTEPSIFLNTVFITAIHSHQPTLKPFIDDDNISVANVWNVVLWTIILAVVVAVVMSITISSCDYHGIIYPTVAVDNEGPSMVQIIALASRLLEMVPIWNPEPRPISNILYCFTVFLYILVLILYITERTMKILGGFQITFLVFEITLVPCVLAPAIMKLFPPWRKKQQGQQMDAGNSGGYNVYSIICCYKESEEVILASTVALSMLHQGDQCKSHVVYVSDDGPSVHPTLRKRVQELNERTPHTEIRYWSRKLEEFKLVPGGGKSQNLNVLISHIFTNSPATSKDIITVTDCDHLTVKPYLEHVLPYFDVPDVCIVQTPQHFYNIRIVEDIFQAESSFWYLSMNHVRERWNSTMCCGTNFAVRANDLFEAGLFPHYTSVEDTALSLEMYKLGKKIAYHGQYSAAGQAPIALHDIWKQRVRWFKGMVTIFLSEHNPWLQNGLSISQRLIFSMDFFNYMASIAVSTLFVVFLSVAFVFEAPLVSEDINRPLIAAYVLISHMVLLYQFSPADTYMYDACMFLVQPILFGPVFAVGMTNPKGWSQASFDVTEKDERIPMGIDEGSESHFKSTWVHQIFTLYSMVFMVWSYWRTEWVFFGFFLFLAWAYSIPIQYIYFPKAVIANTIVLFITCVAISIWVFAILELNEVAFDLNDYVVAIIICSSFIFIRALRYFVMLRDRDEEIEKNTPFHLRDLKLSLRYMRPDEIMTPEILLHLSTVRSNEFEEYFI